MSDTEQYLETCHLFQKVDLEGLRKLVSMARRVTARKGTVFFRQGSPCPGLYVVGKGLVRLYTLAASGKEHVLHMAGPGSTFAEIAVIGGFPCPATAEAVEASTLVLLPGEAFNRALQEDHAMCLQLLAGLTVRTRHLIGLLEDIVLRDACGRLARYLLEAAGGGEGEIVLPSLKRHLASHLNLTSETLSRTLRRLVEAGFIEALGSRRLRVKNAAALREISEGLYPLL